jgi:hypothetical protein
MNKWLAILCTMFLTEAVFAKSQMVCEAPSAETIESAQSTREGSQQDERLLKRLGKGSSLVFTRDYGYGTFNTVTFWLKKSTKAGAEYYQITSVAMDSDEIPTYSFNRNIFKVSGGLVANEIVEDVGLYSPSVVGEFKETITIGKLENNNLPLVRSYCQK